MKSVRTGWRIGDLEFRPDTGELRSLGADRASECERLPPQPAQLLDLLASRSGELVTREEIAELLWPETHVDLDQSLSFCVRQIRTALGDSPGGPVDRDPAAPRLSVARPGGAARRGASAASAGRSRAATIAAALGGLLALAALLAGWIASRSTAEPRLAVMPFELSAPDSSLAGSLAGVSETLVAELSGHGMAVVGPRSTHLYAGSPFPDLERLVSELDADYVLNARFLDEPAGALLLVELIRLSDRTHPWVRRYAPPWDWPEMAVQISAHVSATIAADRR
ncbi:MAG: winged helix-turn-helix domain-containing protein [Thermoanaerobaculia bacterium]